MSTLWSSRITTIGADAAEMIDGGVIILFGEPVPEALAEVSVVHSGAAAPSRPITAGDLLRLGDQTFTVDAVGERAMTNLTDLGHIVIYVNEPDQELLPGAVLASGPTPTVPAPGGTVEFTEA